VADFWQDQTAWPRDTQERVFLGRAVNRLGRALFGEEWTGEEPIAETFFYLRIATDQRATNNFIARHLPQFGRKEYRGSMAPPPTGYDGHSPKFKFSEGELQEMELFIERHNETVPPAKERFKKVQNAIADYAVGRNLETSFRPFAGGDFSPIPASWWNTERLAQRFAFCSLDPDKPFKEGGTAWIFVARDDFEEILLRDASTGGITESDHVPSTNAQPGKASRPGRKKGQGSLDNMDSPFIEEMRRLLQAGKAPSPEAAAKLVAHRAHGTSTFESKVDRLAKKYRARHGSE
jgi:hypothetical protein